MSRELRDRPESWPVTRTEDLYRTDWVMALRQDTIRAPGQEETFDRLVLEHPGAVIVLAFILVAIFAPLLTPYSPGSAEWANQVTVNDVPGRGPGHFLGLDRFGSDLWTQMVFGARQSLIYGIVSTAIGLTFGAALGAVAGGMGSVGGRIGTWVDVAIMRLVDIMLSIPSLLLAVSIVIGVPFFMLAPSVASRLRHQGHLVAVLTLITVAGFAGMWLAPAGGAWLWAALLGAGGAVFPVTLSFFGLRTTTAADTAALSTMAQSIGYLLAASGPFLVGLLHDATGSWSLPCILLVCLGVVQASAGYLAGRPVKIGA